MSSLEDRVKIDSDWKELLIDEFSKPYMLNLRKFLLEEKKAGKTIYPESDDIFNAFNYTPFSNTKVIIIGQDPYHGLNQAHGLCFSVKKGVKKPPSLENIFKEISGDLNFKPPKYGTLVSWAKQGVLLINSVLTVEAGKAGSHQNKGWEIFTDKVIEILNHKASNIVFILWGSYAAKKGQFIDKDRHLILKSTHPSPLSAYRGFFGNHHFSQANNYLTKNGKSPIDWQIED